MSKDKDFSGTGLTEGAAVSVSAGDQLSHAATFDCTVVGGDSSPSGHPLSYMIELKIHAPWPDVPVWLRTMFTKTRVTFAKAEGRTSRAIPEADSVESELLAACKQALTWRALDGDGISDPTRSVLISAIAKSEGRTS